MSCTREGENDKFLLSFGNAQDGGMCRGFWVNVQRRLVRKASDNNDLNKIEPAVLSMSRGLSPKNALEDHQNGGKSVASTVAEIIYRNSFVHFENSLIHVSKEIKGKSYQIAHISIK